MARYFSFMMVGMALWIMGSGLRADDGQTPASATTAAVGDKAVDDPAGDIAKAAEPETKAASQEKKSAENAATPAKKYRVAKVESAAADDATAAAAGAVELFGAIKDGKVNVKFIAKSDHDARVLITNNTNQPMTVQLPPAFAGVPALFQRGMGGVGGARSTTTGGGNNQANQGVGGGFGGGGLGGGGGGLGGGGGGGFFSIPPEQTAPLDVAVVCLDHGLRDPSSAKTYKMVPIDQYVDRPAVVELVKALGRGELQHGAAQAAAWHLNNDLSWSELAAKQQGTVRSTVRPPYFSSYEIQAGMAYANEAGRRGQLAELAKQSEKDKPALAESSDAISTAPDHSREPAKSPATEESDKKSQTGKASGKAPQKAGTKATVGTPSTQP